MKQNKRRAQPRRNSVADRLDQITDIVSSNHVETIERLTRLETSLAGIPERVEAIERRNQKVAGAMAAITALWGGLLAAMKHLRFI